MQNAPYLANIAFEGISGLVCGESVLGDFALLMHDAKAGRWSLVNGQGAWMMAHGLVATSTPSAMALSDFLQVLFYLMIGGVALKNLFGKKPTHAELATKKELAEGLAAKAEKYEVEHLDKNIENLRSEMKADDEKIHKRVGAISIKLATVAGEITSMSKNVELLVNKEINGK